MFFCTRTFMEILQIQLTIDTRLKETNQTKVLIFSLIGIDRENERCKLTEVPCKFAISPSHRIIDKISMTVKPHKTKTSPNEQSTIQ